MRYKLVVFDWDGTLMDSADRIVHAMQAAAGLSALPVPSAEEVRQIIGISLKPAIERLFAALDPMQADAVVDHYKHSFRANGHIASPLFNGVRPLLQTLKQQQRLLAVATGKARAGLDNAFSHTQTGEFFITSRCADEAASKPSPDMLQQILAQLNIAPEDAVMIGDTMYDMAMAEAIGVDRIGVAYGVHSVEQLAQHQPRAIVQSPDELLRHL